jgi:hypothetical protein
MTVEDLTLGGLSLRHRLIAQRRDETGPKRRPGYL